MHRFRAADFGPLTVLQRLPLGRPRPLLKVSSLPLRVTITEMCLADAFAGGLASAIRMRVAADHVATGESRNEELKACATATKILHVSASGLVSQAYGFLQVNFLVLG